jgi:hypothetical protein
LDFAGIDRLLEPDFLPFLTGNVALELWVLVCCYT